MCKQVSVKFTFDRRLRRTKEQPFSLRISRLPCRSRSRRARPAPYNFVCVPDQLDRQVYFLPVFDFEQVLNDAWELRLKGCDCGSLGYQRKVVALCNPHVGLRVPSRPDDNGLCHPRLSAYPPRCAIRTGRAQAATIDPPSRPPTPELG